MNWFRLLMNRFRKPQARQVMRFRTGTGQYRRLVLNASACIGCGVCARECPAVFFMHRSGIAQIMENASPAASESSIRLAVESCPVIVIDYAEESESKWSTGSVLQRAAV